MATKDVAKGVDELEREIDAQCRPSHLFKLKNFLKNQLSPLRMALLKDNIAEISKCAATLRHTLEKQPQIKLSTQGYQWLIQLQNRKYKEDPKHSSDMAVEETGMGSSDSGKPGSGNERSNLSPSPNQEQDKTQSQSKGNLQAEKQQALDTAKEREVELKRYIENITQELAQKKLDVDEMAKYCADLSDKSAERTENKNTRLPILKTRSETWKKKRKS